MNGEGIDVVGDVLNQPEIQENYPMDFTGSVYSEEIAPEEVYEVSSAQRIAVYQERQKQVEAPTSGNEIVDIFGRVLDVAAKTYQQISAQNTIDKFKTNPYVTTALDALGYPTVRKAQTGIDTGMKVVPLAEKMKQALSSVPSSLLLIGAGFVIFMVVRKK